MISLNAKFATLVAVAALAASAGCAGQQSTSFTPNTKVLSAKTSMNAPIVHNRFADAIGNPAEGDELDALIEENIDLTVTGADRTLAHKLMRLMPANKRGDFIYYDGSRILGNNPDVTRYAALVEKHTARMASNVPGAAMAAKTRHIRSAGACSPPDPYPGTGPYLRAVSNCGYNGGWGIVQLSCNSSSFASTNGKTDAGYLYFESRDENGQLFEAGLFTQNGAVLDPYISGNFNSQLNNGTARYQCGQYIGIMAGVVNAQIGQYPIYYTSIGTIVNYNPQNAFLPTETVTETNPAWLFITAPGSNFNDPGTDSAGVPTPCRGCSVTKVTSIAQNGADNSDKSTFGIDSNGYTAIHWNELTFGEWLPGCNQGALCTLEYSSNSAYWYAGQEYYPNSNAVTTDFGANGAVWESYDGIVADFSGTQSGGRRAEGVFQDANPPSCAPDSYGYCVATHAGGFTYGIVGYCHAYVPIYGYRGSYTYVVQTQTKALISYTETYNYNSNICRAIASWNPSEPRVKYNDPNLP